MRKRTFIPLPLFIMVVIGGGTGLLRGQGKDKDRDIDITGVWEFAVVPTGSIRTMPGSQPAQDCAPGIVLH